MKTCPVQFCWVQTKLYEALSKLSGIESNLAISKHCKDKITVKSVISHVQLFHRFVFESFRAHSLNKFRFLLWAIYFIAEKSKLRTFCHLFDFSFRSFPALLPTTIVFANISSCKSTPRPRPRVLASIVATFAFHRCERSFTLNSCYGESRFEN